MCGIVGILGAVSNSDTARVGAMTSMLVHRGPNAASVKCYRGAIFGHRRLTVIDLSDRGIQPMESADGRHVIVFNGEIYNYRELRQDLERGHAFMSDTDTEVLLAAYRRWGEDCLERLNGMFAFCIYDTVEQSAFFARDRFGQKPLYLYSDGERLFFASEVKALYAAGLRFQPDLDVWSRYLLTASYDDGAATYFAGVSQLEPGECAYYRRGRSLRRRRYYRLAEKVSELEIGEKDAVARTRELLVDSARLHMRSDVPVGVALSGGLDSSCLLACLALAGELGPEVGCVSVDFGDELSEARWIRAAAKHHGLNSRIENYTPERFRASIGPVMWHLEGPIGGLMNCALVQVMETARDAGMTVIQDGTGLDEAFAGYRNHHNLFVGSLIRRQEPGASKAVEEYALNWGVSEAEARHAAERELDRQGTTIDGTIPVRREVLAPDMVTRWEAAQDGSIPGRLSLKDELIGYLEKRKIPRNTRMKDRVSMAFGLELRLPFLDHRLVEFALGLPAHLYFLHGRSKSVVREALRGAMDEVVRIAPKRSIQAPQGPWLRKEPMKGYVLDILHSRGFRERGLFDVEECLASYGRFCEGAYDNSFFVWQWINVEEWFRTFVDGDPVAQVSRLHWFPDAPGSGRGQAMAATN